MSPEGSMSTFLGVCESGTQSMIRVTDIAEYINIRYQRILNERLLGSDLVSSLLRGNETLSDRCDHQPEPIEIQGT